MVKIEPCIQAVNEMNSINCDFNVKFLAYVTCSQTFSFLTAIAFGSY